MSNRVALALVLVAAPAVAEDRSDGVTPGAFRGEPAGGMVATGAAVVLDGDAVGVALSVTARAPGAIRLDLPRVEWLGEAESYPDRQFPELTVAVDGRPVRPGETVAVTAQGRDVSAPVRAAGLDPFAITETPPFVAPVAGRQAAFDALAATGAIRQAPEGLLADWQAARTVRVPLRAGAHVATFRYRARPAFSLTTLAAAPVRWGDYCTAAAAAAAGRGMRGAVVVRAFTVPVALDGARPVTVTLRVTRQAGTAITCGADGRALIDPTGAARVRVGADGAVRVLLIARPGVGGRTE